MKKTLFTIMAAALILSACQKYGQPVNAEKEADTITVTATATNATETKVTMGAKAGDAYQMSWNNSECTFLREIIIPKSGKDTTSSYYGSSSFTKKDAHSGSFSYNLTAASTEGTYDYVSVYPCDPTDPKTSLTNGVRYGGALLNVRISYMLSHETPQVPTETGPDNSTHIYMATDMGKSAQATSITLNYKSVVSYGKMTVRNFPALAAGETVSKITVTAPGKIMTGRLFHYFRAGAAHAVDDIIPYSITTVKPYVTIDPQNITFNTTAFNVWFTTFPFDMVAGDKLNLTVETSLKTYNVSLTISKPISFTAGKVSEFTYNYTKADPIKN